MRTVRVSFATLSALMGGASECQEIQARARRLGRPAEPQVPDLETAQRLWQTIQATPGAPDGSCVLLLDDADLEPLLQLLPTCAREFADDPAEMAARLLGVWPEDLEAAQAELLAAVERRCS